MGTTLAADDLVRARRGAGIQVTGGARVPDVTLFALKRVMRGASYSAKVLGLVDPDGNPLYINS